MSGGEIVVLVVISGAMLGLPLSARRAARALGESDAEVRRLTRTGLAGAVVWLAVTATLGLVHATAGRIAWFTATSSIATVVSASSAFGSRIARGLSPRLFVGFESFRIATGLVVPGLLPDAATGILALLVGVLPLSPRARVAGTIAFSVLGIATLAWGAAATARFAGYESFPLCQVPLVGLPAALFGHVVAARWLIAARRGFRAAPPVSGDVSVGNRTEAHR